MKGKIFLFIVILMVPVISFAQGSYKQPPKEIMDVLGAPATPSTSISPTRDRIALLEPLRYPPISELAQPMLRIAGLRINPNTTGQHRQPYAISLRLRNVSDGKETAVAFPAGAQLMSPQWAPDGKHIAVGNITLTGIELWIVNAATAKAAKVKNVYVNTAFGGFSWTNSQSILAITVPAKRGSAPSYQNLTPTEPNIQETSGRTGAVQTFQDLLKSPNDEKLFEYYATGEIAVVDVGGKVNKIGTPAIYDTVDFSPDGKYIRVLRIKRPFSYQYPFNRFPRTLEVWDANGKLVREIADLPLQDNLPVQGVSTGPRGSVPHMDGYELTQAIRAEEKDGRRMPIIALTANALKGEAEHCRAAGMDDYRSKPAPLVELKSVLDKWLPVAKCVPDESVLSGLPKPTVPPAAGVVPVDVKVLKGLVGDDPALVHEFLQDFRASAVKITAELRAACAASQTKAAVAAAHKLKSSARAVGALALGDLCAAMEEEGKAGDSDALTVLLPRFEAEMAVVEDYLDKLQAKSLSPVCGV